MEEYKEETRPDDITITVAKGLESDDSSSSDDDYSSSTFNVQSIHQDLREAFRKSLEDASQQFKNEEKVIEMTEKSLKEQIEPEKLKQAIMNCLKVKYLKEVDVVYLLREGAKANKFTKMSDKHFLDLAKVFGFKYSTISALNDSQEIRNVESPSNLAHAI